MGGLYQIFGDLILLMLIGVFGGLANLWLGQSYKLAEVSLVSPLKYLALVFAIAFGYFIWDEIPSFKNIAWCCLSNNFLNYNF